MSDRPKFGYDEYPDEGIVYEWDWIKERIADIYGQFDYCVLIVAK